MSTNLIKSLERAIELSFVGIEKTYGRPFGAVVVYENEIVGEGFNTAVRVNDPTAHAEVNAIRAACARFATYILPKGAILLSSAEPCPLCFSASFWAGIDDVYFALSSSVMTKYGFADGKLGEKLGINGQRGIQLDGVNTAHAEKAFQMFLLHHPTWEGSSQGVSNRDQL